MRLKDYNFRKTWHVDVIVEGQPFETIISAVNDVEDPLIRHLLNRRIIVIHKNSSDMDSVIVVSAED